MNSTQFQTESTGLAERSRFGSDVLASSHTPTMCDAAIESLLLGFRFRGWLAASEKDLLNRLSAADSKTFLLCRDRFQHPEAGGLFPLDLIRTAHPEDGHALFRHHYRPETEQYTAGHTIHSALVNPGHPQPITLGLYATDASASEPSYENRFAALVDRFRNAALKVEAIYDHLRVRFEADTAVVLINRCSGRLMYINNKAQKLFARNERELVDLEFTRFKKHFASRLLDCKVKLVNVSIADNHFTVLMLSEGNLTERPEDLTMSEYFTHKLRNKISAITTASSHLKTVYGNDGTSEEHELADIILNEATELDTILNRFQLLIDYDRLPCRPTDPVRELNRAVDLVVPHLEDAAQIEMETDDIGPVGLEMPMSSLKHLFEAVLRSHMPKPQTVVKSRVSMRLDTENDRLMVCFITSHHGGSDTTGYSPDWMQYSNQLARTMGLSIEYNGRPETMSLSTTITIPVGHSEQENV